MHSSNISPSIRPRVELAGTFKLHSLSLPLSLYHKHSWNCRTVNHFLMFCEDILHFSIFILIQFQSIYGVKEHEDDDYNRIVYGRCSYTDEMGRLSLKAKRYNKKTIRNWKNSLYIIIIYMKWMVSRGKSEWKYGIKVITV